MKTFFFALALLSFSSNGFACVVDTSLYAPGINVASAPCSQQLLLERSGFSMPDGGLSSGSVYHVTSLADSGPGTLREGLLNSAWIVFSVSGNIELLSPLRIQNLSDITIDGRGQIVSISGYGLYMIDAQNIIINNIEIRDGNSDAVDALMIVRSNKVWIHKTSLSNFPDGLLDITRAASTKTRVTVSWSRFSNHKKSMIIGLTNAFMPSDKQIYVTVHHNYFAGTEQRHPRLSQGYAHVYNNVIFWDSYGMASFDNARLLVENNIFSSTRNSPAVKFTHPTQAPGRVRLINNAVVGDKQISLDEYLPQAVGFPWYGYGLEQPSECMKNNVMHGAGANRKKLTIC